MSRRDMMLGVAALGAENVVDRLAPLLSKPELNNPPEIHAIKNHEALVIPLQRSEYHATLMGIKATDIDYSPRDAVQFAVYEDAVHMTLYNAKPDQLGHYPILHFSFDKDGKLKRTWNNGNSIVDYDGPLFKTPFPQQSEILERTLIRGLMAIGNKSTDRNRATFTLVRLEPNKDDEISLFHVPKNTLDGSGVNFLATRTKNGRMNQSEIHATLQDGVDWDADFLIKLNSPGT